MATSRADAIEDGYARLESLRREFQALELEQMKKGEVEARAKLANVKKDVDKKRDAARRSIDGIRGSGASLSDEEHQGVEDSLDELEAAVERARKDFEGTLEEEEEEEQAEDEAA